MFLSGQLPSKALNDEVPTKEELVFCRINASVISLYDEERLRGPHIDGNPVLNDDNKFDYGKFDSQVESSLSSAK